MPATYCRTDLVRARMMLRIEQGPNDCEPLGCDGDPALMTPRDELAESFNCVPLTPPSIHQPDFSHKPLLAEQPYGSQTTSGRILFPARQLGQSADSADTCSHLQLTTNAYSASCRIVNLRAEVNSQPNFGRCSHSARQPFAVKIKVTGRSGRCAARKASRVHARSM